MKECSPLLVEDAGVVAMGTRYVLKNKVRNIAAFHSTSHNFGLVLPMVILVCPCYYCLNL